MDLFLSMDVYGSNKNHLFNPKNANHLRSPVTRADTHTQHSDLLLLICSKKIKSHKKMNQGPSKRPNIFTLKRVTVPVVG